MKKGIKIISLNKKAGHEYFLYDTYEAGLALLGTEIKSLRTHGCTIKDAYVLIKNNEAILFNLLIPVYEQGNRFNHQPDRTKKLLLHKKEIFKMDKVVRQDGYALIPTKIYLRDGKAKIEIAVGKGKELHDKRESERIKDIERENRRYKI
ncbi:MAG: SsrA-binding protein SmpB [Bacillales bacterium]|jgi:SsrA-binding protein|nr:SsrA-binding protein SmpB [Bacillales bacterium]